MATAREKRGGCFYASPPTAEICDVPHSGGVGLQEGPEMRESLREERTLWVTDQIAQDKFPEDLEAFYLLKNPPSEEKPPAEEEGGGKKGKVSAG